MKSKVLLGFLTIVALFGGSILVSCSDEDKIPPEVVDPEQDIELQSGFHGVTYPYKAFVAGSVGGEMREALGLCLTNTTNAVDDETRLVVLSKFSDIDEASLEKAYDNGATIAVVYPVLSEIDKFFETHSAWKGIYGRNHIDGALIFSFDSDHCFSVVAAPEEVTSKTAEEAEDTGSNFIPGEAIVTELDYQYSDTYTFIGTWLSHLVADEEITLTEGGNSATPSVDSFAAASHYVLTKNFKMKEQLRKLKNCSPDSLTGKGSITVAYDIYQVHVYDGEAGAGDYYLVSMTGSVANDDMFKGKWTTHHGLWGTLVLRLCGYYGKEFSVSSRMLEHDGTSAANVTFVSEAWPSPATTVGQTNYSDKTTFSLEGSISAGAGKDGPEGKAELTGGWSWEKGKSRDISDTDISNTSSGSTASWKLTFNNLPEYSVGKISIELGKSQTYRSTQSIHAAWVWYEKDAHDNVEKEPYVIECKAEAKYGAMSFLSTKADLKEKEFIYKVDEKFQLDTVVFNKQAGMLMLNNDFTDNKYISQIKVYRTDNNKEVYTDKNSYAPGKVIDLGAYTTDKTYQITFNANVPGQEAKEYIYKLNPTIPLTHKIVTTLNANNDFRVK